MNLTNTLTKAVVVLVASAAVLGFAFSAKAACTPTTTYGYTAAGVTLRSGAKGPAVVALQTGLKAFGGATTIAIDGSYGPMTANAVKMFQASKMLSADGIAGPMTQNALAAASATTTSCDTNTGGSNGSLSGEGSIDVKNVNDADDTSLSEGQSGAEIGTIKLEAQDGDVRINRIDVTFNADGANDEMDPWKTFDSVSLEVDGDEIASMDTGSKSDWDETSTNDTYRLRFSGIDLVVNEDDTAEITVVADIASSVDGTNDGEDWEIEFASNPGDADGIRFEDGDGFLDEAGSTDTASFSIEESGATSEFTVSKDSSSPSAGSMEVKENTSTTETIAVFKVKADSDGADIKINDFPVDITIGSTGTGDNLDEVVDDVYIVVDGTTYNTDDSIGTGSTQTFNYGDLEDDDVVVNAGDTMKVTVKVKFKSQGTNAANYANGSTVLAEANVASGDVEDADSGDDVGTVDGTASAETMTLYSTGVSVSDFEVIGDNPKVTSDDTGAHTKLSWTVRYKMTAFGDDFYIPKGVLQGTTLAGQATAGLAYTVYDETGAAVTTSGTESASAISSTADTDTGRFVINEGDTETFTATISVATGTITAGHYVRAQLEAVGYDTDTSGNVTNYDLSPAQDYYTLSDTLDA